MNQAFRSIRTAWIALLALAVLTTFGCWKGGVSVRGSGTVATEVRQVSGFHGVDVRNQGDLIITFGPEESLEVEAEDNLQAHLSVEVRDGILIFETVPPGTNLWNTDPIVYRLTAVSLDRLSTSSAGSIFVPPMEVGSLAVRISSAGSIEIASLIAHALRADLSSAGNLTIGSGAVIDQSVTVSSAGSYDAGNMSSERAVVDLSSAGQATVQAHERLEADISSAGNLYYRGAAEPVVHSTSLGKAIRLEP